MTRDDASVIPSMAAYRNIDEGKMSLYDQLKNIRSAIDSEHLSVYDREREREKEFNSVRFRFE